MALAAAVALAVAGAVAAAAAAGARETSTMRSIPRQRCAVRLAAFAAAVGLFVAARRPFLDELTGLGRRRALDASRLAALYQDASGLLDRLLLRLIATHQEASR